MGARGGPIGGVSTLQGSQAPRGGPKRPAGVPWVPVRGVRGGPVVGAAGVPWVRCRRCRPGALGERCQLRDPCVPSPCAHGGLCQSTLHDGTLSHLCLCPPGFRGEWGVPWVRGEAGGCPPSGCGTRGCPSWKGVRRRGAGGARDARGVKGGPEGERGTQGCPVSAGRPQVPMGAQGSQGFLESTQEVPLAPLGAY